MSALYYDTPAAATKLLKALPLKYTEAQEIYGEREIDDHVRVLIFGQPFSYEWAIQRDGKIEGHSDCGYGIADVALIDGLTAYYKPSKPVTEEMVSRFLSWKLPASVRPDECVLDQSYPHRIGTNLLTAIEARAMLEHVLAVALSERMSSDSGTEKLLREMLDRAYKMMQMAGYRVVEQDPDHNNPIIAWMADARALLYGGTKPVPDVGMDLQGKPLPEAPK